MSPLITLAILLSYFGVLIVLSWYTSKDANDQSFYTGNKKSPWFLVAFGMIGASLSGVTFLSVPGAVVNSHFGYFQVVLGYMVGYIIIARVLLPLYYRLNLTSIYTYLESRYGTTAYKTGAAYFLLSRVIGASFRLFLIAGVLHLAIFQNLIDGVEIPYWITVAITIALIFAYTAKSGIKTVVYTDALQTFFLLASVVLTIIFIVNKLEWTWTETLTHLIEDPNTQIFHFEGNGGNVFWKQFLGGAFIALAMTGLDQDMMQKNLSCRNLKDAQKNMFWFTIVLVIVNFFFLALGVLLTDYAQQNGIDAHKDELFPIIATKGTLGLATAMFFLLGLIAAAYSSADSALTSLTTSFSIDILEIDKKKSTQKQENIRKKIHVLFSAILIAVILIFKYFIADESVIAKIFTFAGYTYGPLLGLYAFGLFTKFKVKDKAVPFICIISPLLTLLTNYITINYFEFDFEFFVLVLNGCYTFIGLILLNKGNKLPTRRVVN
ncbi:MAG TPA: sodium:solute symporter [Bacteroidetes bacterium]|nr:sodium:solute symporter [Bacteroidota bacterium]